MAALYGLLDSRRYHWFLNPLLLDGLLIPYSITLTLTNGTSDTGSYGGCDRLNHDRLMLRHISKWNVTQHEKTPVGSHGKGWKVI